MVNDKAFAYTTLGEINMALKQFEAAIAAFEQSGRADTLQLQRLKKMKLGIKDQISKIENILLPDIIA